MRPVHTVQSTPSSAHTKPGVDVRCEAADQNDVERTDTKYAVTDELRHGYPDKFSTIGTLPKPRRSSSSSPR